MAIQDNKKLDLLWKKVGFGVAETSFSKSALEENIQSVSPVLVDQIWQQSSFIPSVPSEIADIVELVEIQLVRDASVRDGTAWLAEKNSERLTDFIGFTVAPEYEVQVFSDSLFTKRLLAQTELQEWLFDYAAGVLWFPNGVPDVSDLFLRGYRYVGLKGLPAGGSGSAGSDVLTMPTSGTYGGGYLENWKVSETKVSDAFNQLNHALKDMIPPAPPVMPTFGLTVMGGDTDIQGIPLVLSKAAMDSTGLETNSLTPGMPVRRVNSSSVESNMVGPFGPGNRGTLRILHNSTVVGQRILTTDRDDGVFDKLVISGEASYPENKPGFHQSIRARAVDIETAPGLNCLQLEHSESGSSNVSFFVKDSLNSLPELTSFSISVDSNSQNILFSSGVPHYGRGTRLLTSMTVKTLATDLSLAYRNLEITSSPANVGNPVWVLPGAFGLPETLVRNTDYTVVNVPFVISDNQNSTSYGTTQLRVTANNANGSVNQLNQTRINVMRQAPQTDASNINENSVLVEQLGAFVEGYPSNAYRIALPDGNTPEWDPETAPLDDWSSSSELPAHEAAVVGGVIQHTATDYSGFLPKGPNYSDKPNDQYITFAICRRAVSRMCIDIEGRYQNLFVKLAGVDNLPLSSNGWWNAHKQYEGFGTPGREISDGCAQGEPALGGGQRLVVTFGQENSSNAASYMILVRFHLVPGQAITGLRFSGVNR